MPLTREQTKYNFSNDTVFLPTVAIDKNLGVLGNAVFNGNVQINGTLKLPNFVLPTASSIIDGIISWDSTNKKLQVGTGTASVDITPFTVNLITKSTPGTYTLVLSDANTLIKLTSVNGEIVVGVPSNVSVPFAIGTRIDLLAIHVGSIVRVAFDSAITSYATPGLKFRQVGSMATLIKIDTDTWVLAGDLTV